MINSKKKIINKIIESNKILNNIITPETEQNITNIIDGCFNNYSYDNIFVLKNIISGILNKNNLNPNDLNVINHIIDKIDVKNLNIRQTSLLIFIIDKLNLYKNDPNRINLLKVIQDKFGNITDIKDYIELSTGNKIISSNPTTSSKQNTSSNQKISSNQNIKYVDYEGNSYQILGYIELNEQQEPEDNGVHCVLFSLDEPKISLFDKNAIHLLENIPNKNYTPFLFQDNRIYGNKKIFKQDDIYYLNYENENCIIYSDINCNTPANLEYNQKKTIGMQTNENENKSVNLNQSVTTSRNGNGNKSKSVNPNIKTRIALSKKWSNPFEEINYYNKYNHELTGYVNQIENPPLKLKIGDIFNVYNEDGNIVNKAYVGQNNKYYKCVGQNNKYYKGTRFGKSLSPLLVNEASYGIKVKTRSEKKEPYRQLKKSAKEQSSNS